MSEGLVHMRWGSGQGYKKSNVTEANTLNTIRDILPWDLD